MHYAVISKAMREVDGHFCAFPDFFLTLVLGGFSFPFRERLHGLSADSESSEAGQIFSIVNEEWIPNLEEGELMVKQGKMGTTKDPLSKEHPMQVITDVGNADIQISGAGKSGSFVKEEWIPDIMEGELMIKEEKMGATSDAHSEGQPLQEMTDFGNTDLNEEPCDWPELSYPSAFVDQAEAPFSGADVDTDPLSFDCDDVITSKRDRETVLEHRSAATTNKPYTCYECDRKLGSKLSLKRHIMRHTREYACPFCDSICTGWKMLIAHRRSHSREKRYICDGCDFRARGAYSLATHKDRIHSGQKRYVCDSCDSKFIDSRKLLRHKRSQHTTKNPFSCDVCDYSCNSRKFLEFHMRSHTGVRSFECEACHFKFKTLTILTRHMKKHKTYLFECESCQFKFKSLNVLVRHTKKHETFDIISVD